MTRIKAMGTPVKHPELGEIVVSVKGTEKDIRGLRCMSIKNGACSFDPAVEKQMEEDLRKGPSYPLCAEPRTMLCAYFVLLEWFDETTEPSKHVTLEGEIEPMEYEPGVIY